MRILLYGMQSSGASAISYLLAQAPACLAFVDVWSMYAGPAIESDRDIVAKVVVTSAFPLSLHRKRFKPDLTVLVLRHPADVVRSLVSKGYANDDGMIEEKLSILDETFKEGTEFDSILYYEDFHFSPRTMIDFAQSIGWPIDYRALHFPRTREIIKEANLEGWPDSATRIKYGMGGFTKEPGFFDRVRMQAASEESAALLQHCPALVEHYEETRRSREGIWDTVPEPLLSCGIQHLVKTLVDGTSIPVSSRFGRFAMQFEKGSAASGASDDEVALVPQEGEADCRLTIQGLPGRPFNRLSGYVRADFGCTCATATIELHGKDGELLAKKTYDISRGDLRVVNLSFKASGEKTTIMLAVDRRLGGKRHAIRFGGLRLDHLPPN